MKKLIITEEEKNQIMGLYGKSNIIIEQSTNSGDELEKILISKFVDENQPRIGVEYKDPSIRDDFFNEYSSEYQSWLAKNGFKMSDINLESGVDQSRLSQISNLIKQKGWDRSVESSNSDWKSSPKAQYIKEWQKFLNQYYNINMTVDGNWKSKEYGDALKRYFEEKGIPVWVCKKGDGYCHDNDEGEITTKGYGWDKAVAAKKLDMSKQQDKINTTNDRTYDYKLSNGKYYYSLKGQNKWVEAKGKGLEAIKTKIKF